MSSPELSEARERFEASQDFTVGIEEEFALLDPETLQLVPRYVELKQAADADPLLAESAAGELISSEIEIRSGRGEDVQDALERQAELRRRLFALAASHDVLLGSTGTHPLADYREQEIIDTEHYRRLRADLGYVAYRNNTWSLHVHVGIAGADRVIRVMDRMRPVLPELLALSANSPFIDGRDSGLHSGRTQIFTKSFPRCGIPDPFGDWRTWEDYVDLLVRTNSIVEFTQVWWSIRPHHSFGTLEVRICDAQSTAPESDALAQLIVACVAQAALEVDEGVAPADLPPRLLEENVWRALRFGRDGKLLRFDAGGGAREVDAAGTGDRLLEWTAPVREALGLGEPALPELNGAQRQRRLIAEGLGPAEVYAAAVRETQDTYAKGAVTT